jgi:hypothetical protein
MSLPSWWASPLTELDHLTVQLEKRPETVQTGAGLRTAVGGARAAATSVLTEDGTGRGYRRMRLRDIPMPCPSDRSLHPTGAQLGEATISILYECWEDTGGFQRFGNDALDRIRRADVQVRVAGTATYGTRAISVQDHWRVDTHHFAEASPDPHPWIHYQRGGHAQDAFAALPGFLPGECLTDSLFEPEVELTALMQTPAPRIATPPLDPICAIDFVLAQHSGTLWSSLWSNVDYAGVVRRAQERLWEPWFAALNDRQHRRHLMPFYGAPRPRAAA